MSTKYTATPLTRSQAIEMYFMEHRAKLIDIAAFLDRLDRSDNDQSGEDFRIAAFRKAIDIVRDAKPNRARRVLEHFSDPTDNPIDKAPMKGALGAFAQ
jgi:hypothetical protein